jgi:CcmD family protein
VNEQAAQTAQTTQPSASEELALRQLHHVGAAYAVIFALILLYAWRLAATTKRLSERVEELERDASRGR